VRPLKGPMSNSVFNNSEGLSGETTPEPALVLDPKLALVLQVVVRAGS